MEEHGTREELASELRRLATGWDHLAKPRLAADTLEALQELEDGASTVRAGHTRYVVTD